jgi:hypothetical protein
MPLSGPYPGPIRRSTQGSERSLAEISGHTANIEPIAAVPGAPPKGRHRPRLAVRCRRTLRCLTTPPSHTKDQQADTQHRQSRRLLYEQIIQSARGTRWIWAMTFASCIERLANMLEPPGRDRSDADADATTGLVEHIKAWRGDDRLKGNAINAVKRSLKRTTIVGLRQRWRRRTVRWRP